MQQAIYPNDYQEMCTYYRIRDKLFTMHGINSETLATMSLDDIAKELRLCMIGVAHHTDRIINCLSNKIAFIVIMTIVERCGHNYAQALYELQYIMRATPQIFELHAVVQTMEMIRETTHDDRAIIAPVVAYALTHVVTVRATCSIVHQLSIIPNMDHAISRCIASLFGQASHDTPFRAQCNGMHETLSACIDEEYMKQINSEYLWH